MSDGGSDRTGSGFGARRTDISLKILLSEEKSQQLSHSLAPRDSLALPLEVMLPSDQLSNLYFNPLTSQPMIFVAYLPMLLPTFNINSLFCLKQGLDH